MDKLIPFLKSARPLADWKLWVEFEDGIKGTIDLSVWKTKGGVFDVWNDVDNFKRFTITPSKKIQWNETIDMDPDSFYLQLVNMSFEEYARNKQILRHHH